jgi:hypothetical protein
MGTDRRHISDDPLTLEIALSLVGQACVNDTNKAILRFSAGNNGNAANDSADGVQCYVNSAVSTVLCNLEQRVPDCKV